MIVWLPVMDELDRNMFAWTEVPGWTAAAGWYGQNMYAKEFTFTLEEVYRGEHETAERRGIIWKWEQWGDEKFKVKPVDPDEDDFIEACQELGYSSYTTEPIEGGGFWIIPEELNDRPPQVSKSRRVERKPTKGDGL